MVFLDVRSREIKKMGNGYNPQTGKISDCILNDYFDSASKSIKYRLLYQKTELDKRLNKNLCLSTILILNDALMLFHAKLASVEEYTHTKHKSLFS